MKSAGSIELPDVLSENKRTALLTLLTDEDPAVYHAVREEIISYGPSSTHWLRQHALSSDPAMRRRSQEIVTHFARQDADNRFLAFCLRSGQDFDLEHGAWMLAQTQYPDINVEAYQALLDTWAAELRERIHLGNDPKQILTRLNDYLFRELGFSGNEENYYAPENSYLNRVIDRRTGNPINQCLLYMLMGRRLRLPIAGIGLPGHFICRYQATAAEVYIDPFNRGKFLTKADCVQYLVHGNFSVRDDYLAPVNPRKLLLRICANLHQTYVQLEQTNEATRLQRYLVTLGR